MASQDYIVAIFPSRGLLTKAVDHLMSLAEFKIEKAAIIAKAASGETIILDDNISPDEGGIAGGTLAAAMTALGLAQLGALALPGVGPIIAIGAGVLVGGLVGGATGRIAANLVDSGLRSSQLQALAEQLQAGHPALILEMRSDTDVLPRLRIELKVYRAELVERLKDAKAKDAKTGKTGPLKSPNT
ncbi:MAG: hypothetical protein H7Y11_02330 [Armatimonadetes bacterium]|nr:hypothetical protein [Anaerolineae bacterium]